MRLNPRLLTDTIKDLSFYIDFCEWEEHSETKGELMVSRAHAEVALNKLNDPSLDNHYRHEVFDNE